MRRVRRLTSAAALIAMVAASPAAATEHLMRVNEVGLSVGGMAYVELFDTGTALFEVYPNPPYSLVTYDAVGAPTGQSQTVSAPATAVGTPRLLAAGPVMGETPDQNLAITLPAASGAVCFQNGSGLKIHCMKYGSFTGASFPGPLVPAISPEQSAQVCGSGTGAIANPTPRATNNCNATGGTTGTTGTTGTGGTTACLVPNVKGLKLAAAKTKLKKAHCATGTVKRKTSTKAKKDRVIAQSIRAGTKRVANTKVGLTVGKGPAKKR
jgi:hypothetical protein